MDTLGIDVHCTLYNRMYIRFQVFSKSFQQYMRYEMMMNELEKAHGNDELYATNQSIAYEMCVPSLKPVEHSEHTYMKNEGLVYDEIEGEWDTKSFWRSENVCCVICLSLFYCTEKDISIDDYLLWNEKGVSTSCVVSVLTISLLMQRMKEIFHTIRWIYFRNLKNVDFNAIPPNANRIET